MGSVSEKTYYELLGIDRNATEQQIRTSYKEIARVYHPDSNFFSEIIDDAVDAEEIALFKKITSAYTTLLDRNKRAEYDLTLPPILREWDNEPEQNGPAVLDPFHAMQYYRDFKHERAGHPSPLFEDHAGDFGADESDHEEFEIKSVAEMVHERTLMNRLRTFFGLR
jgi:DnaJ-class molecular chaperone